MAETFSKPRKRFGQHFLHDRHVIDRIIQAIQPQTDDQLIEIGPGRGALTLPLLAQVGQLDIVEIDRDLVQWWQEKSLSNLSIHAGDALKLDYCALQREPARKLRVIGNLPYNISTPLLFHLFENLQCIQDMHFMLQKEVVDRMCAVAAEPAYGRLSVMVQFYCEVTQLFDVGAGAFTPPPKVESSIVRLVPHAANKYNVNPQHLQRIVSQAFNQRRKTLRNSLKHYFSSEQLEALGVDPGIRPERLELATFIKLAQHVSLDA
jgi:16S rRNA (adenine1518-N6/adenine1519-N6)-dimethyltransferase